MEIKNHNKDRKRTGMRKRFSIAAYLAVFACVVLLVFQYFGFISKTVYEESVSHLTEVFFFKQKTAYEIRPREWSSDVCSSDLAVLACIVLLVSQYFGFVSKTIYEESVSHLTEVFQDRKSVV